MKSSLPAFLAALSLVVAPVTAEAKVRTASPAREQENFAGSGTPTLLIGLALIAGLVVLVGKGSGSSGGTPASP